jgi:hypothetical protein
MRHISQRRAIERSYAHWQAHGCAQRRSPGLGRPGQRTEEPRGVSGGAGWPFRSQTRSSVEARLSLLIEPPRVASLFQLRDDVIGNGVSLSFGQPFFQSANDLAGAAKGKGDGVPKDLSSRHVAVEHKENRCASRYILYTAAIEPLCGSPAFSLVPTPSGCQACPLVGRCVTFLDVPLIARQAVEGVEIRQPAES